MTARYSPDTGRFGRPTTTDVLTGQIGADRLTYDLMHRGYGTLNGAGERLTRRALAERGRKRRRLLRIGGKALTAAAERQGASYAVGLAKWAGFAIAAGTSLYVATQILAGLGGQLPIAH